MKFYFSRPIRFKNFFFKVYYKITNLTALLLVSETVARSYDDGSFTQYLFHLHKFVYDPRETRIHMQIRTRDSDGGVLMFNAGSQEGRYSLLEVKLLDNLSFFLCGGEGGGNLPRYEFGECTVSEISAFTV